MEKCRAWGWTEEEESTKKAKVWSQTKTTQERVVL